MLQESLTNISKYARADAVQVRLGTFGKTVRLEIIDQGDGFDSNQSPVGKHGIVGMRFRVASLGGTLPINSAPGHGTAVIAVFPLNGLTERALLTG